MTFSLPPTASSLGQLIGGSATAPTDPFYSDTASAVSAGAELALSPKSHVSARPFPNPRNHAEEIENAMRECGYAHRDL